MKTMKKLVVCLVMLLTFAMLMTACGGGETQSDTPKKEVSVFGDDTTGASKEESTPAESSKVEEEPSSVVEEEPSVEEPSVEDSAVAEEPSTEEATSEEEVPTTGVPTVTGEPEASDMAKRSLMQMGNNYRIKRAIEKAQNGEEVIIAYVGGSITEGAGASPNKNCYAYRSYEYFKETYANGGDNVKFVNAGMSGTPSTIGMIRYDRDVVEKVGEPDIVIVEFAVNDGDDPTAGNCFESLVVDVLKSEKEPAVILLFSVFKSQWNLQDRLKPVGQHYDLPMISIKDAVVPELKSGSLTDAEFFADVYHPSNKGHQIMADCINYYFDMANYEPADDADITIPEKAKIGTSFVGVEMIDTRTKDDSIKINAGMFSSKDNVLGTFSYAPATKTFPDNWSKTASATGDSYTMELDCKNLIILYKSSNSETYGKAEVYVDGVLKATLSGYSPSGWNNPLLNILINENEVKSHKIEIKMQEGSEGKAFTIFGFGYTK